MPERPLDSKPIGDGNRDDRDLEELFAEYVERINAGEKIDPQELIEKHPRLAADLLRELDTYQSVQMVGSGAPTQEFLSTLGDYTLRRQIGRGGMGVVYEAWENSMDRAVALKVLPAGIAADGHAFQRFMQEAKTAGKLSHPNVVPVYFTGVKEQTPFYAMELVDGETLAQIIAKTKDAESETETPFGKRDSVVYFGKLAEAFAEVADGLQHAHSKGVTHRDIKPSNLILDHGGRLRILDFGLARLEGQESLTLSGDVMGTPLYMSPEQARRKKIPVDHRTDVYSLGATMYEAICGHPPFRGKDHQDTLSQIIEREPVGPRKVNPRVPKDLETIVLKCLRKDCSDRYGTAEALGQDLRRFVRGDPIEARPKGTWEVVSGKVWLHRWRIVAVAIACVLVGMTAILLRNIDVRQRERARATYWKELREVSLALEGYVSAVKVVTLADPHGGIESDLKHYYPQVPAHSNKESARALLGELTRATEILPERPEAHYIKARALAFFGSTSDAWTEATLSLEKDPMFVPAQFLREELNAGLAEGIERGESGNVLHQVNQGTWQWQWWKAHQAVKEGHWTEASKDLLALYRIYERDGEPYPGAAVESLLGRGQARLQSLDYSGAIRDFGVAAFLWPDALTPRLLLGKAYYLSRHEEWAEEVFQELLQKTEEMASAPGGSSRADPAFLIAELYLTLLEDHDRSYDWATKISDKALSAAVQAECLYQWGRYEEAARCAKAAVALNPSLTIGHAILGLSLRDHGDREKLEEAKRVFERFLEVNPKNPVGLASLGHVLCKQGKWDEGYRKLQESLRVSPGFYHAQHYLGRAYFQQGRLEDAKRVFGDIYSKNPWRMHNLQCLAWVHIEQGAFDAARALCKEALARNPRYWHAKILLGVMYLREGRSASAVDTFREMLESSPIRPLMYRMLIRHLDSKKKLECPEELQKFIDVVEDDLREVDLDDKRQHERFLRGVEVFFLASQHESSDENIHRAMVLVEKAVTLTNRKNARVLRVLARLFQQSGQADEANRILAEVDRLSAE